MNYRPPHDSRNRPSIIPEKKTPGVFGTFGIILQLFGLLALVRLVMIEQGMRSFNIPILDSLLADLLTIMKRWLTQFGILS